MLALHGVKFSDTEIEDAGFASTDSDLSFAFLVEQFGKHEPGCRVIFSDDSDRVAVEVEPYPVTWFLLNADDLKPKRLQTVEEAEQGGSL